MLLQTLLYSDYDEREFLARLDIATMFRQRRCCALADLTEFSALTDSRFELQMRVDYMTPAILEVRERSLGDYVRGLLRREQKPSKYSERLISGAAGKQPDQYLPEFLDDEGFITHIFPIWMRRADQAARESIKSVLRAFVLGEGHDWSRAECARMLVEFWNEWSTVSQLLDERSQYYLWDSYARDYVARACSR